MFYCSSVVHLAAQVGQLRVKCFSRAPFQRWLKLWTVKHIFLPLWVLLQFYQHVAFLLCVTKLVHLMLHTFEMISKTLQYNEPFLTVLHTMVSSSLRFPLVWVVAGWMLAPPLRIHSWRVKWSPDNAETTESGTTATWLDPLKEKTRDESEDGRVGSAEVQLAAGDGGGRRSTSPLTAPGGGEERTELNKNSSEQRDLAHKAQPTTQPAHRSVRVAVSVTALPDVARLQLYGGLDVPHGLLTGLQMQAGEQGDAAWARCVLNTLGPSLRNNMTVRWLKPDPLWSNIWIQRLKT